LFDNQSGLLSGHAEALRNILRIGLKASTLAALRAKLVAISGGKVKNETVLVRIGQVFEGFPLTC
jgi:hypothetical protein